MEARKKTIRLQILGSLLVAFFSWQCGSFQGVSYYQNDGIYNNTPVVQQASQAHNNTPSQRINTTTSPQNGQAGQNSYYQNYFQNLSDEYASTPATNDVFVDVDGYSSATPNNQPWGAQPNKTEIYVIQNRPFNPFFMNRGWGWNRFDFWQFNQPWFGFNNWGWGLQPYWGWAGFNSFYNPFWGNFFGPQLFYNPYRWYRPYHFRSRHFRNYNNRPFDHWNAQSQRYARVASRRGEKTYRSNNRSDEQLSVDRKKSETKSQNNQSNAASVRYNVGRNLYSIGYDRIPANLGRVRSPIPMRGIPAAATTHRSTPQNTSSAGQYRTRNQNNTGTSQYNQRRNNRSNPQNTSYRNTDRSYNQNKSYNNSRSYRTPRSSSGSYSSSRSSGGGRSGGRSGGRNQQSPQP